MNLTLAETATKPSGYLPVRAAKVKSMPSAPIVAKGRKPNPEAVLPALPKSFSGAAPLWYETDGKYASLARPVEPAAEMEASLYPPGTRRLRNIPREVQRPLESRLYHLRKVHRYSEARCSHVLDLHPADLDALAATHGEM
jgi:hypothetical protein